MEVIGPHNCPGGSLCANGYSAHGYPCAHNTCNATRIDANVSRSGQCNGQVKRRNARSLPRGGVSKPADGQARVRRLGRMKRLGSVAVAIAALCAPASALGGTFAPSPTTGNPKGVKLAHEVMRAFGRIPAFNQSEQHFFQIKYESKTHRFAYRFGKARQPGFVWTTEKSTIRIHHNHVLWWQDALTPVSGHRSPVMIVLNKNGRYTAFGTPGHHSCFTRLPSKSMLPYRYGGLGDSIGGRMAKPERHSKTVVLPYAYRWEQHLTANETDTIRRATKLVRSSTVDITHHNGSRALAFNFGNSYPRRTPRAPAVNLCGG